MVTCRNGATLVCEDFPNYKFSESHLSFLRRIHLEDFFLSPNWASAELEEGVLLDFLESSCFSGDRCTYTIRGKTYSFSIDLIESLLNLPRGTSERQYQLKWCTSDWYRSLTSSLIPSTKLTKDAADVIYLVNRAFLDSNCRLYQYIVSAAEDAYKGVKVNWANMFWSCFKNQVVSVRNQVEHKGTSIPCNFWKAVILLTERTQAGAVTDSILEKHAIYIEEYVDDVKKYVTMLKDREDHIEEHGLENEGRIRALVEKTMQQEQKIENLRVELQGKEEEIKILKGRLLASNWRSYSSIFK